MAKICPKCTADTEPLEEETSAELCIHEKIVIASTVLVAAAGILLGTGTV
jgi:hypothetical protein